MHIVLGTRGSQLALTQSQQTADLIQARTGVQVELRIIRTRGDRIQDRSLAAIGGKGLFTAELEAALREGSVDIAVHSLKDLPTEDPEGLVLGAVPERADPRDTLAGLPLSDLAAGVVLGTGSLRRRAQIDALCPGLDIRDIRGNVDTRLRKLDEEQYDTIILAMAGLARLGIERPDLHPLSVEQMIPAVGQGALGVQARAGDARVLDLLAAIEHPETRRCVEAERAFLTEYGGGCNVPAACHARLVGGALHIMAMATGTDGQPHRVEARGDDGEALGRSLAERIREL